VLIYVIKPAENEFCFQEIQAHVYSVIPQWFDSSFPPLKLLANPVNSHLPVTRCDDDDDDCQTIIIINTEVELLSSQ
jgi:hypothetical protein